VKRIAVGRTLLVWTGRKTLDCSNSALSYVLRDGAGDMSSCPRSRTRRSDINTARRYALITSLPPVASRRVSRARADKPELKESTFLSSRSAHSNAATSSDPASRSTTPTPGNPHPDAPPPPPVARSGMLKIRVTAAKGLALPQGGKSILWI
jgi:hypothetical protein